LQVLVKYPSPRAVTRAGAARLSAIKGISKEKARALLAKAARCVHTVSPQTQHVLSSMAQEILHKESSSSQRNTPTSPTCTRTERRCSC
jgi:hypothetical protein